MTSYHGSRAVKYRHMLDDALGLAPDERALLCVLMLRGPQTLGELKQRTEKLHRFADLGAVEEALDRLTARELGRWLERRPGQKEARYTHLLEAEGAAADDSRPELEATAAPGAEREDQPSELAGEVARLRQELEALRAEVGALRERLDA